MNELARRLEEARAEREKEKYGRVLSDEERDRIIDEEDRKEAETAEENRRGLMMNAFLAKVPRRFSGATFENFVCGPGKTEKVVEYLKSGRSAVIYGSNGTGKTHLAFAACRHQIAQGRSAEYVLAFDFFNSIRESFGGGNTKQVLARYEKPTFLVVDEIDKTQGTPTEFVYLYHLINMRYNDMKSTVLITNAEPSEFGRIIGESALDRVASEGKVINLTGENYRQRRK